MCLVVRLKEKNIALTQLFVYCTESTELKYHSLITLRENQEK